MPEDVGSKDKQYRVSDPNYQRRDHISPRDPSYCEKTSRNRIAEVCTSRCNSNYGYGRRRCTEKIYVKHCGCDYDAGSHESLQQIGQRDYEVCFKYYII